MLTINTERICKVVKRHNTAVANAYKYANWVYRVVECEPGQQGYLNERGVKLIWQSEPITYVSQKPTSKMQRNIKEAEQIATHANICLAVGLSRNTPPAILSDFLTEHSLLHLYNELKVDFLNKSS